MTTHLLVESSVIEIHERAFYNCLRLVDVEFPYGLKHICRSAFERCRLLAKVSIPVTVEKIDDRAFGGCFALRVVSFTEGLQYLGNSCFQGCSALKRISIPRSVNYIGESAFSSCRSLVQVNIPEGSSLEVIRVDTFRWCMSLPYIALPSSIKCICEYAFSSCESLVDAEFAEGIQSIGASAFRWCTSLARIEFPSTLTTIGEWAFGVCKSLTHVDFVKGLQTIEDNAFANCSSLRAISIPASMKAIGTCAFNDCVSLVGVEFPASSKVELGSFSFQGCKSLVNVSIPSTIENVQEDEFCECPMLAIGSMRELRDRFERLPIHRACYHHTGTTTDSLGALLDHTNEGGWIDAFDMTPFHILATSPKLRPDLFRVLLDCCPLDILAQKDPTGRTSMDYLRMDPSPKSTETIKAILRKVIVDAMSVWGLECWRSEISSHVEYLEIGSESKSLQVELDAMTVKLASYAKVEKTSVLELALWNNKLKSFVEEHSDEIKIDRESSRTICGTDVVVPNVTIYLWDSTVPPMAIANSMFPYDLSWLEKSNK